MFLDHLRLLVHGAQVTEHNGKVTIYGPWVNNLLKDMAYTWKGISAAKNMFDYISSVKLVLDSWFVVDFYQTLLLMQNEGPRYISSYQISKIIEMLIENTWLKNSYKEHPTWLNYSKLNDFKYTPDNEQMNFFKSYEQTLPRMRLNGGILDGAAGSGKTFTMLALCRMISPEKEIYVVPGNTVKTVWVPTINEQLKGVKIWTSLDGRDPDLSYTHYIVHNEYIPIFRRFVYTSGLRNKFTTIALDELHKFNERDTIRSSELVLLHKDLNPKAVWGSGTVFKAVGMELLPFLRANDPLFTQTTEERFISVYGKNSKRGHQILSHRIKLISFKIGAEKVQVGVNKPITERIDIKMPGSERYTLDVIRQDIKKFMATRSEYYHKNMKTYLDRYEHCLKYYETIITTPKEKSDLAKYRSAVITIRTKYDPFTMKDMAKWVNQYEKVIIRPALPKALQKDFDSTKSIVKYVHLVIQGEALGTIVGKRREECAVDIARHLDMKSIIDNADKKTVIFSSYVEPILVAKDKLEHQGYSPLIVYQKTNKHLDKIIKDFNTNPDANPILATTKSLSESVPLIAANVLITLDMPMRDYIYTQLVARIARRGQDTQVRVFNAYLDTGDTPNISTRSEEIYKWSKEMVEILTGAKLTEDETNVLNSAYVSNSSPEPDGHFSRLVNHLKGLLSLT